MTLVSYAGAETKAERDEERAWRYRRGKSKPLALTMFRNGLDTAEIAERLGRKEHQVLKALNKQRSLWRSLPDPYREPGA